MKEITLLLKCRGVSVLWATAMPRILLSSWGQLSESEVLQRLDIVVVAARGSEKGSVLQKDGKDMERSRSVQKASKNRLFPIPETQ